ncbi:12411_t:CDS:2 [Acaulospora morrowiae]|uniref:12411_t:CDS:1 n=1 Tax=Acaulospora morrowiae TaxID=94023 RepID=A0A9N9BLE4_9GLOM|nr:12411_t:CDS:2 [Acaulospora morrowiae]
MKLWVLGLPPQGVDYAVPRGPFVEWLVPRTSPSCCWRNDTNHSSEETPPATNIFGHIFASSTRMAGRMAEKIVAFYNELK